MDQPPLGPCEDEHPPWPVMVPLASPAQLVMDRGHTPGRVESIAPSA